MKPSTQTQVSLSLPLFRNRGGERMSVTTFIQLNVETSNAKHSVAIHVATKSQFLV